MTTWAVRSVGVRASVAAGADQGFAGRLVDWAATRLQMTVEIVRKPAEQRGFAVHPKRWVVGDRLLAAPLPCLTSRARTGGLPRRLVDGTAGGDYGL